MRPEGMDIKLVVSDIDDTLLPKGGAISERTRRAVARLNERGIPFALASGRWFPSTVSVAREVGCLGPFIVANGGCIVTADGAILKEFAMRDEDVLTAYGIIKGSGALVTSYVRGAIYRLNARSMNNRPPERLSYFGGDVYEVVDDDVERFETEALRGVYKMEAYSNDEALLSSLRERLTEEGLSVSSSFRTNIEITSMGLGKGTALLWLAERLGIAREDVMAFGDNTNDMQMIRCAGWGVAMGNAVPDLKQAARLAAADCSEDGLARAIEEYVL